MIYMNIRNTFGPLAAGLFLAAGEAFRQGQYTVGVWIALGCVGCAWITWASWAGTPDARTAARLERILEDIYADRATADTRYAAATAAIADVSARVQAVMVFLQATQTYTTQRQVGANGRPASPIKHPLRPGP